MSNSSTLFRCTFQVFGVYTHGKLKGKTNPKQSANLTFYGESFKDCKGKLNVQTDGAFWKPIDVVDLTLGAVA